MSTTEQERHEKTLKDAHRFIGVGQEGVAGEGFLGSDRARALVKERKEMIDLLGQAAQHFADDHNVPEGWYEKYFNLTDTHMVLVDDSQYGFIWASPKTAECYEEDQIIREINVPEES